MEIDPDSIPGNCPLNKFGSTNRDALKIEYDEHGNRYFDEFRLQMLHHLVKDRYMQLSEGYLEADPLKVFVKQEPHKNSKLEVGRVRLIAAVSLVDTMVDRILFGELLRTAMKPRNMLTTPCVVGWTPLRGGWRYLQSKYPEGSISIDRTAWDWTVQLWLVEAWKEFLFDIHVGAPNWWQNMVSARLKCLFEEAVFRFSDGVAVKQKYPGIMKSGCLLTLYLNSVSQTILHILTSNRLGLDPYHNVPLCAGDDTIQLDFAEVEEYSATLNCFCITKEVVKTCGFSEFIGFLFNHSGFVPAYWEKHLFNLRHIDVTVQREALQSYQILWYNDPIMLSLIREFAYKVDPHILLSDRSLREIANG